MLFRELKLIAAGGLFVLGPVVLAAQQPATTDPGTRVEVSAKRNPAKNAFIGAAVGAASGAIFGAAAPESCCVPFGWSQGAASALWAGIGAGGGAVIGLVVGQLGHDPLPPWKAALIGGAIGGARGALGGALFYSEGTGYYAAFGAGMGLLVGTAVGLANKDWSTSTTMAGGRPVVRPAGTRMLLGWQRPFGH